MNVFLDANVLIIVLNKEYPKFPNAAKILSLANGRRYRLYTSPICLAIAFYFASKVCGEERAKEKIAELIKHIRIAPILEKATMATFSNKKIIDVEDGLKYYAAKEAKCDLIVTEDSNDFYFSDIPVYDCSYFLTMQVLN
ncbi:MAG: hypothetical protein RL596_2653 [Bacteroidota bacterium]|jgi:predicted nucleic acid-binding protein